MDKKVFLAQAVTRVTASMAKKGQPAREALVACYTLEIRVSLEDTLINGSDLINQYLGKVLPILGNKTALGKAIPKALNQLESPYGLFSAGAFLRNKAQKGQATSLPDAENRRAHAEALTSAFSTILLGLITPVKKAPAEPAEAPAEPAEAPADVQADVQALQARITALEEIILAAKAAKTLKAAIAALEKAAIAA